MSKASHHSSAASMALGERRCEGTPWAGAHTEAAQFLAPRSVVKTIRNASISLQSTVSGPHREPTPQETRDDVTFQTGNAALYKKVSSGPERPEPRSRVLSLHTQATAVPLGTGGPGSRCTES